MLPSPQSLAQAIAKTSFSLQEKREILMSLPKMTEHEITELYDLLLALHSQEVKFLNDVKLLDLKYQTKVQILIDEAKARLGKKQENMENYLK